MPEFLYRDGDGPWRSKQIPDQAGRVDPPPREFFAGLDLGQTHDPTALALCEAWTLPAPLGGRVERAYDLRHLERYPLNTSYVSIVELVAGLLDREPLRSAKTTLAIDWTGCGRPVADMFERAELRAALVLISIHGGNDAIRDGRGWHAPKRDLIGATQVLLQQGRLRVAPKLALAGMLQRELQDYRVTVSAAGHDSYSACEGQHDDILLATALAYWTSERARPRELAWY